MKKPTRNYDALSQCGLNCLLCPMRTRGYCHGCAIDSQSCRITRCSKKKDAGEFCHDCNFYPCPLFDNFFDFDSFISHRAIHESVTLFKKIGKEEYRTRQEEKRRILVKLLENYDDGRKKSFYHQCANLIDLEDLKSLYSTIEGIEMGKEEKKRKAHELFLLHASEKGIDLKLKKK